MPKMMPALFVLPPAGSSGREGTSIVTGLPVQVSVASTMGPQVQQIKSHPLGAGQGNRAGKLAQADPGRP